MASINTEINMIDKMSGPLYNINSAVEQVVYSLQDVGAAMNRGFNATVINIAESAINKVNDRLDKTLEKINRNTEAQQGFIKAAQKATSAKADNEPENKLLDMAYDYMKQGTDKLVDLSDTMTQNTLKFDTISDGLQPVKDLQDKIFASAQRSRTGFLEMTDIIVDMGQKAKDVFSSNDETIAFAENLNKIFTAAGASQSEITAASSQVTQALSSGAIRADALNSIFESTPYALQLIADYLNVSKEELNKMANQGEITGGVVKNALLSATDAINAKFETVPMTWGQIWTNAVNKLIYASQPILSFISLTAQYWSILEPLVIGVATALGLYVIATKGVAAFTAVQTFLSIGFGILSGNTAAASAAMFTYNSALLACPLTWIIMLLIAIIAIIYAVVAAVNHFTGSTTSATGIIAGAFAVAGAYIYNNFAVPTWNAFAAVANFLGNVFNEPAASVKVLFYDMAQVVIGYILNMAKAIENVINKIPGVNIDITSGLDNFYKQIEKASQAVKDESGWVEYVGKMKYMDYGKAAGAGYQFGEGIDKKISGFFGGGKELNFDESGLLYNTDSIADNVNNIANNPGSVVASATISEEDLKYLRDLAEQEAVNRFTTAEIKIEQTNHNNISSTMDVDGIVDYLTSGLNDAISKSAEGVHV